MLIKIYLAKDTDYQPINLLSGGLMDDFNFDF